MSQTEQNVVVLVADDEPSTLALVSSHVRSRGYKVLEASDGDQAWQLAHEHLPDLVILDVMMPGMSGWEVCRKIREAVSLAHTGVIMLTGIGENLNEMTSPLYGADAYLDKPFEFADLDAKVTATLEERREGAMGRPDPDAVPRRQTEPPPAGANGMGAPVMARSPQAAAKRRAEREAEEFEDDETAEFEDEDEDGETEETEETEAGEAEASGTPTKRVAAGRPTKKMPTPPTPRKKAAGPTTKVATKTRAATPAAKKKAKPAPKKAVPAKVSAKKAVAKAKPAKKAAPAAKKAAKKVAAKKSAKAAPAKKAAKKVAKAAPAKKAVAAAKKSAKAAPVAKKAAPVAKKAAKAAPSAKAAPKKANSSAKKMAGAQAL